MERILKKASKTHKHRVEVSHGFRFVQANFTKINSYELIITAWLSECCHCNDETEFRKAGSHQRFKN